MVNESLSDRETLIVMMVTFASAVGGAERSMLSLATHLPGQGLTPVLVCPEGPLADQGRQLGLRVATRPLSSPRPVSQHEARGKRYSATAVVARTRSSISDGTLIRRVAAELEADLIYSNSLPSHLPTALAGRIARRPVLWHLREIVEPGPGRSVLSLVGRLTEGMIAISNAVAASVDHPSVTTVYNPVAEPPLDPVKPAWELPKPLVGYLGRIDPRKGIEDLVAAAEDFDAHVAIVGNLESAPEDYVSALRALAAKHGDDRVHFVGSVDDPWSALAEFDVLVVPSIAEPFGRVAAEGQRAGVPVIVADAGGLPEIVTEDDDGLRYPPGDVFALSKAITRLLGDPTLSARLASTGIVTSRRFDPTQHAAVMADLFRRSARAGRRSR